jgi:hypothetical protein
MRVNRKRAAGPGDGRGEAQRQGAGRHGPAGRLRIVKQEGNAITVESEITVMLPREFGRSRPTPTPRPYRVPIVVRLGRWQRLRAWFRYRPSTWPTARAVLRSDRSLPGGNVVAVQLGIASVAAAQVPGLRPLVRTCSAAR